MVWFLNDMKTATIELPDAVFHTLEGEAARHQQTLTSYIAALLARDATSSPPAAVRKELDLPLIRSSAPGTAHITNALLAEIEAQEDAEHYGRFAGR
jgi:hypothetical protein